MFSTPFDWVIVRITLISLAVLSLATAPVLAVKPTRNEMVTAKQWVSEHFRPAAPLFSFVYDGKQSSDILAGWKFTNAKSGLESTQTYTDPKTGLQVKCVAVMYKDFPTVEWTVYFKNTGKADTPIIENIQSLDARWTADKGQFLLHHAIGSSSSQTDYRPLESIIEPKSTMRIGGQNGRPTSSDMSYFNLEMGGKGVVIAVGWPAQWSSNWVRDDGNCLRVTAGQELTHFVLHPGEEVRAPMIVLQFWQGGDWIRAQNIWRRWMIAHNVPRPGGKLPPPQLAASSSRQFAEMANANEENQNFFIDRYLEENIKIDYWWMDAGWYPCKGCWGYVGTWEVDKTRFPNGLRAVSDHAHSKGLKIITWFEPERVYPDTWLYAHPQWLLTNPQDPNGQKLLDMGNEEAWTWLTNHVDEMITEQGIDLYRQDFNVEPLVFWKNNDTPDRQGITENRYACGFLAYWDALRKRHPNVLIDTCASGGRRNDVETLRRSVPLWRTDFAYNCIGTQCHTYGISFWIPYSGTGTVGCQDASYYGESEGKTPVEPYAFFSNAAPSLACGMDMRKKDLDYASWRKLVGWFRQYLGPNFYGDYYPLTPYSAEAKDWIAWQFDRPEIGEGVIEAFRRTESPTTSMQFKLCGLEPKWKYELTDVLAGKTWTAKGSELIGTGISVGIAEKPGVSLIAYKRIK